MPLVLVTVWRMLVSRAHVQAGDFVLIWGASGGLGVMAIQIAKLFNARPIAVASSDEKLELCAQARRRIRAQPHARRHLPEVRRITDGRRADIVFEHTGADTWPISMQCLKWGGTIVTCGATSGFDAHMDIRLLWNKQQNYLGSHLGNKGELIEAMRFVGARPDQAGDRPHDVPLKELGRAQDLMETQRGGRQDRDAARIRKLRRPKRRGSETSVRLADDPGSSSRTSGRERQSRRSRLLAISRAARAARYRPTRADQLQLRRCGPQAPRCLRDDSAAHAMG